MDDLTVLRLLCASLLIICIGLFLLLGTALRQKSFFKRFAVSFATSIQEIHEELDRYGDAFRSMQSALRRIEEFEKNLE